MKLSELIEQLQDLQHETEGDPDVRLAHQPQWPFEYHIGDVALVEFNHEDPDKPDDFVIYIAESGQIGYLPGVASRKLGWR